jgi:autotransporter translocation and assembly factor TamB
VTAGRALRRLLIALAIVIAVVGATLWLAFRTGWGARTIVAFALGKSKSGVEIGRVDGRLSGPLYLHDVRYRSGALSAEIDSVLLDWRPRSLLRRTIRLDSVFVTGLRITLPDSAPPDTTGARRERPNPPMRVLLGQVRIDGIAVNAFDNVFVDSATLRLSGELEDYRFELDGHGFVKRIPRFPHLAVRTAGRGNLEKITIERTASDVLDGRLSGGGTVAWWPKIVWDLALVGTDIRPGLMMPDPATLPGTVTVYVSTTGSVDSAGPSGRVVIDSTSGVLKGKPVRGRADIAFAGTRYDLTDLDGAWGPVRLRASGGIGDTLSVVYAADVSDLRQVMPNASGSISVRGAARGPRAAALVHADVDGRAVGFGTLRFERVAGRADVGVDPRGRTDLDLTGTGAKLGIRPLGRLAVAVRGNRPAHTVTADLQTPHDTVRLEARGGLEVRTWRGQIDSLTVRTFLAGPWRLERPTAVTASATAARIDSLCLAADSVRGRACAVADWRGGRVWDASAQVVGVPLVSLSMVAFNRFPGGPAAFSGTLGGSIEAHSTAARLDLQARMSSDSIGFAYRERTDTALQRMTLDSAAVNVTADANGMVATMGLRVLDHRRQEVAVVSGNARLPDYRVGRPVAGVGIEASIEGKIDSLGFARPLFASADSLSGAVGLTVKVTGTADAPVVDGRLGVEHLVYGTRARNAIAGSFELTAKGAAAPDRSLQGQARLVSDSLRYRYRRMSRWREILVDSATANLTAGASGLHGTLGVLASRPDSVAVGFLSADLTLPGYTKWGLPVASQPMTLTAEVALPDLGVIEPFLTLVDSVGGQLAVELTATGQVATPSVSGSMKVDSLAGRMALGTRLRGGLDADFEMTVARDSTISGSLTAAPRDMVFLYPRTPGTEVVRLDSTSLRIEGGPNGVRGTMAVTLADSAAVLATMRGTLAMPGYTRVGRPLAPEPIQATLNGRVDDLVVLEAFTSMVDSAKGNVTLDAKLDGTLGESHLTGGFDVRDASMWLPFLGIKLEDLQFTATGDQAGDVTVDGRAQSGGGTLSIIGSSPVQPNGENPGRVQIRGTRFEAIDNAQAHAIVSPRLDVRLSGDTVGVQGDIELPLARVVLTEIPEFAVAPSTDVIFIDSLPTDRGARALGARVRLTLGDSVSFQGFNFNAELGGSILIDQEPGGLATAAGTLRIEEGRYKAYGQDLTIEDGQVRFTGGPVDNPGLSIRAQRTAEDSTVAGISITGTLKQPDVTLYADRDMSESQMLSYIVRGSPIESGGAGGGGNMLSKALTSLGLRGGNVLAGRVGETIGLEDAKLETKGSLREASFVAGRYLSPRLYLSYGIGLFDPVSTLRLRYVLSSRFTLEARTGAETSADLLIKTDPGRRGRVPP